VAHSVIYSSIYLTYIQCSLRQITAVPIPNLEYLDLYVDDDEAVPDIQLFDIHPPLLRHLRLHELPVNVVSKTVLRSLLTFSVTQGWDDRIGCYTVTEWLGILVDLPALQHLVIESAIVRDTFTPSEALPMVHLDHLERLVIDGPFHETMTLINYLTIPSRCSFDFTMSHAIPGSDVRTLATFLERNLSSWEEDPPFRSLVAQCSDYIITLTNQYMTSKKCASPAKDDPLFHIKLFPPTMQDSLSLFFSLFPVFSPAFPATKTLILRGAPGVDVEGPYLALVRNYFHLFFNSPHTRCPTRHRRVPPASPSTSLVVHG